MDDLSVNFRAYKYDSNFCPIHNQKTVYYMHIYTHTISRLDMKLSTCCLFGTSSTHLEGAWWSLRMSLSIVWNSVLGSTRKPIRSSLRWLIILVWAVSCSNASVELLQDIVFFENRSLFASAMPASPLIDWLICSLARQKHERGEM